MDVRYPARIEKQEPAGFFVQFIDLEDAFTEGATIEEALFNASEVLSGILQWRLDNDVEIPEPSAAVKGARFIAPDARTQAALLVRHARGEKSLADLARVLETSWPAAQRLENPHHWPTLRQIEKAAAACGKKLVLLFE